MTLDNMNLFNDGKWINEVLDASNTGLWLIKIDPDQQTEKMFCNTTMLRLLGLPSHPDPQECYRHWYERIDKNHIYRVTNAVARMVETNQQYEVQYPWLHPERGLIFVRCGGKVSASEDHLVCLCGYHQDVTEMENIKQKLKDSLQQLSKNRHHTGEIERLKEHYQHLAYIDMLTGLPNRRAFFEMSESFAGQMEEDSQEYWTIIADIDYFKKVNDTYGHSAGDEALQGLAFRFKENLRENTEFIGRIGGEEFALFLLESSKADAYDLAERLRKLCSDEPYILKSGARIFMTCSFGIARVCGFHGKSAEEIFLRALKNADVALYQAKKDGRNRAVIFSDT